MHHSLSRGEYSWAAVSWYNREQKELNASMSNLHARIEALLQRLIIIGMKVEDIYLNFRFISKQRAFKEIVQPEKGGSIGVPIGSPLLCTQ